MEDSIWRLRWRGILAVVVADASIPIEPRLLLLHIFIIVLTTRYKHWARRVYELYVLDRSDKLLSLLGQLSCPSRDEIVLGLLGEVNFAKRALSIGMILAIILK